MGCADVLCRIVFLDIAILDLLLPLYCTHLG